MKNPYTVLGVARDASQDEIKKVYRALAKELHPDRHPNDPAAAERFKEVSAAYHILGDENLRRRFDRGEINESGQEHAPGGAGFWRTYTSQGGEAPFEEDIFRQFDGTGMEDVFADLFGGFRRTTRRRTAPSRGVDRRYTLKIGFVESVRGGTHRITLPGGKSLNVKIPAGIGDGQQIRLKGQGDQSPAGGPAGDALIDVHVEPHPFYRRNGLDINVELPVTLQEAVLGGTIQVPTVHGAVSLKVPKGSNTGTRLRLRGKGVKDAKSGKTGDQYVKLKVVLPEKIDAELAQLVEKWAAKHRYDVRGDLKTV